MFSPEPEASWGRLIFHYILSSVSSIGYGVACLVIYSMESDINCTTKGITLEEWVFGSGIAYCVEPVLCASIFGIKNKIGAIMYFSYLFLLNLSFNIVWSILGSLMLFKYSMGCVNNPLWVVALSGLIFQWINIILVLWEMRSKYVKIPK